MKRLLTALILLLIVPSVLAQSNATILENLDNLVDDDDVELTILLDLLDEANLEATLDDEDAEFTLFAPTDDAFEDLLDSLDIDLDDLTDDSELLTAVLSYHLIDTPVESGDLADTDELTTIQGSTITVEVDDETVILNSSVEVITADIQASNGIIHIIDAVLIPELSASSGEACLASTSEFNGASIHVGPGNNRTAVTFLEVDVEYQVLGQNEDGEGVIWYQLDKEEAAPGRAINEAWVSSEEVDTTGDCDNVGQSSAPPVIPITNVQPQTSNDDTASDETTSDDSEVVDTSGVLPTAGSWTIFWNATTNASCQGTGNITINTIDIFGTLSDPATVRNVSSSGFSFFGVNMSPIGNGVYIGTLTLFDLTGTIYIDNVVSSSEMVGRFITSFDDCSVTVTFRAQR